MVGSYRFSREPRCPQGSPDRDGLDRLGRCFVVSVRCLARAGGRGNSFPGRPATRFHAFFESVQRGVLDSRDIIYYLTFVVFFLFLTMRSVSSRKWKA